MKSCLRLFAIFVSSYIAAEIPEKVVICTICRNASQYFPEIIADLENIGSLFQDYRIVAYENNSEDDTPSQLYRWKRANPKVFIGVDFLSNIDFGNVIVNQIDGQFSREEQRALARNKALRMALSLTDENFSHILCIDPNVKLQSIEEIAAIFKEYRQWDAVFAYGVDRNGNFNDWTAFRDPEMPFGPELLGNAWYSIQNKFSLSKNDPWHSVYSAFGGCALYKRKALKNCKYDALVTQDLDNATRKWFFEGLEPQTPAVLQYLKSLEYINNLVYIETPHPKLPHLPRDMSGVYVSRKPLQVVWKNHSGYDQYPSVCEHVTLHASMYCQGHRKLFINPRLVCVEKDNRYESHPNQGE